MITIERICSHDVKFNYFTKSKNAIPNDSEIEHVTNMIIDNYNCGELNLSKVINHREYEFRGWWQIV